ncbi:hypothetical protein PYW07_016869 [Mythimna separata]|uniref:Uncharacterized protein n=1 Tax=Mythimna separata TaxID=271217 RepID=A0AAD8DXV2_MYTSE|nr:hypothetical protein PYW07_016869 [Mythimna separata]
MGDEFKTFYYLLPSEVRLLPSPSLRLRQRYLSQSWAANPNANPARLKVSSLISNEPVNSYTRLFKHSHLIHNHNYLLPSYYSLSDVTATSFAVIPLQPQCLEPFTGDEFIRQSCPVQNILIILLSIAERSKATSFTVTPSSAVVL